MCYNICKSLVLNGLPLVRSASPVAARRTGGVGVVGSNPATPTNYINKLVNLSSKPHGFYSDSPSKLFGEFFIA